MKNKLNESKGITLIALIITIIILLILAGIIIGSISNSGLLDHSRDATQKYKKAQVDESDALQYMEQEIDKSIDKPKIEDTSSKGVYAKTYDIDGDTSTAEILFLSNSASTTYSSGTLVNDFGNQNNTTYQASSSDNIPLWKSDSGHSYENPSITKVVVNDIITPDNMKNWFSGFTNVTEFEGLNKINTSKVTNMSSVFAGAGTTSTNIDIDSWVTDNVSDFNCMFNNTKASKLKFNKVNIKKTNTDIKDIFRSSKINDIEINNWNITGTINSSGIAYSGTNMETDNLNMNSWTFGNNNYSLANVFESSTINNFNAKYWVGTGNNEINFNRFTIYSHINNLDISGWKNFKINNAAQMFKSANIVSLNAKGNRTCVVKGTASEMFYGNEQMTNLDISMFNFSEVTNLNNTFAECRKIKELDLTSFDTKDVTDIERMFYDCTSLEKIYATNKFVITGLTSTAYYVFNQNNLLKGGQGTQYSSSTMGQEYAHIDGGNDNPGLFTEKN